MEEGPWGVHYWPFVRGIRTKKTLKLHITNPFVRGIHRSPVDSPHKGPVMQTIWHFLCCKPEQAVEHIIQLPVIGDAEMLMWCHSNRFTEYSSFVHGFASEWVIKFISFFRTADSGVHTVQQLCKDKSILEIILIKILWKSDTSTHSRINTTLDIKGETLMKVYILVINWNRHRGSCLLLRNNTWIVPCMISFRISYQLKEVYWKKLFGMIK